MELQTASSVHMHMKSEGFLKDRLESILSDFIKDLPLPLRLLYGVFVHQR